MRADVQLSGAVEFDLGAPGSAVVPHSCTIMLNLVLYGIIIGVMRGEAYSPLFRSPPIRTCSSANPIQRR